MRALTVPLFLPVLLFGLVAVSGCKSDDAAEKPDAEPAKTEAADDTSGDAETQAIEARIARYATPELTADISSLPDSEKAALDKIIEAARLLDPIFERQAWAKNPELVASLKKDGSELAKAKLRYVRLMRGPWDRQNHHEPVVIDDKRPAGAGFYPADATVEEIEAWVKDHPDDADSIRSLFTIVKRDGAKLVAVPYSEAFAEWLEPAAKKLEEAAALTKNKSLASFLKLRAEALRTDDYYESDKAWMDLDSPVEVTIGPYEVYEDTMLGWKASFEAFVTINDPAAGEKLTRYKKYLPQMEKNLPIPDEAKSERGRESPIRVSDLVFTAGDARKSVQTIAFNLPNDERVRKEKGAKKVMLRNAIETKFDAILEPIAKKVLTEDRFGELSGEAFFNAVLFHELSHSLGPAMTKDDSGKEVEVRVVLGGTYSAIEECKADAMGVYNLLWLIDKGELPKELRAQLLTTYFAGLFRSVRFGIAEAHGKGAAVQLNRYLDAGAATYDDKTGRFALDHDKLEDANRELVGDLCMLQHNGDRAKAEAFLEQWAVMSPPMEKALSTLGDVPVDIRPVFPLAGESGDPLTLKDR